MPLNSNASLQIGEEVALTVKMKKLNVNIVNMKL